MAEPLPVVGNAVMTTLNGLYRDASRRHRPVVDAASALFMISTLGGIGKLGRLGLPHEAAMSVRSIVTDMLRSGSRPASANDLRAIDVARVHVEPSLREAQWSALSSISRRARREASDRGLPSWDDSIRLSLIRGLRQARDAGVTCAGGIHFVAGLLAVFNAEAFEHAVGDPNGSLAQQLRRHDSFTAEGEPHLPILWMLDVAGVLPDPSTGRLARFFGNLGFARPITRGSPYGGAILVLLESEMLRQAVRRGDRVATTGHALAAIWSLGKQLRRSARRLPDRVAAVNTAAMVLAAGPDRLDSVLNNDEGAPLTGAGETEMVGPDEARKRFGDRLGPPWGRTLLTALDATAALARSYQHIEAGTSHLLWVLLQDRSNAAYRLLSDAGYDPQELLERMRTDLAAA